MKKVVKMYQHHYDSMVGGLSRDLTRFQIIARDQAKHIRFLRRMSWIWFLAFYAMCLLRVFHVV